MKFDSPDSLWKYSLSVALLMESEGYKQQSKILEHRTKLSCTSGWEWLGELATGIKKIKAFGPLPIEIEEKLEVIAKTTKSETPYG